MQRKMAIPMARDEDGKIVPVTMECFMRESTQAPARQRFMFLIHDDFIPQEIKDFVEANDVQMPRLAFDHMRLEMN